MMKTLSNLKTHTKSKIVAISSCNQGLQYRLRSLGIIEGNEVEVLRTGWFRPIHIKVGMTEMFIRKKDANSIIVDNLGA